MAPLRVIWEFLGTLACDPWYSLARFLGVFRALLGMLARIFTPRGNPIGQESGPLGAGLIDWERVVSSPSLSHFILNNCFACTRLFSNLSLLVYFPAVVVGIPSNRGTRYVDWMYC